MSSYFDKTMDTAAEAAVDRNYFGFGQASTVNFPEIAVLGRDTYTTTARRYKLEEIPGAYAPALSDDDGFRAVTVTYHCGISISDIEIAVDGVEERLNRFLSLMLSEKGWTKLSDSFQPHYFRQAVLDKAPKIVAVSNKAGGPFDAANFDISFTCKPQRFQRGGDVFRAVASGDHIEPSTDSSAIMLARPQLKFSGSGTITIDSQEITVSPEIPSGEIVIDCETMDAYKATDGANCNKYVTLPVQTITIDGNSGTDISYTVDSLEIAPMWWSA